MVHITLLNSIFYSFLWWRWHQREVRDNALFLEGCGWTKKCFSLHYFIIFLKFTNFTDFYSEKMHRRHSYFALGVGKVLGQEVQPVLTQYPGIKSLYCVSMTKQFSRYLFYIKFPCTSVFFPENTSLLVDIFS